MIVIRSRRNIAKKGSKMTSSYQAVCCFVVFGKLVFESHHTQQQCFSMWYRSRDIFPCRIAKKRAIWGYAKQPLTAILIHSRVTAQRMASMQYQIPVISTRYGRNLLAPNIPLMEKRIAKAVMTVTNVVIVRSLCMISSSSKAFSKASKLMVSIKKSVKPSAGKRICRMFITILQLLTMMHPRTKSQHTPQQRSDILWSSRFNSSVPVLTRCNAEEPLGSWKAVVAAVFEVRLVSVKWSEQLLGGWFSSEKVSDVSCFSSTLFVDGSMSLRMLIVSFVCARLDLEFDGCNGMFCGMTCSSVVVMNDWVWCFVSINDVEPIRKRFSNIGANSDQCQKCEFRGLFDMISLSCMMFYSNRRKSVFIQSTLAGCSPQTAVKLLLVSD